jgi:dihydrodipicolinate synthase/N-acetylneuraminate lyase
MQTSPITRATLAQSVIAVPPLARNAGGAIQRDANRRLIQHLEAGGVSTLLYGGNALLYHIAISEYRELLEMLVESSAADTLVIPSVGPAYGTMMDQAEILKEYDFPTAMILPQRDVCTPQGVAVGVRHFVERMGQPAVLYIKHDGFIDVDTVNRLMSDGLLSWIKYAIVREDPSEDDYLRRLIEAVGPDRVISGIGEQPAIAHMQGFGVSGFTSGCVCVAPNLSMQMLRAIQSGDDRLAERIRQTFAPLERLRNTINPVRVLHAAVTISGIAEMGPISPLMSEVNDPSAIEQISAAAATLAATDVT